MLLENVKFPSSKGYENNTATYTTTEKEDNSPEKELKNTCPIKHTSMVLLIKKSIKTCQ